MKKFLIVLAGIFLFAWILISSLFGTYNQVVVLRNEATTQRSTIESQMQRRADLIPNLVASTKGAMTQEKAVFDDISKAHAAFTNAPSGTDSKIQAGEALSTAIRGYMVVAQQYPVLQSMTIVVSLNDEMSGTENRINVARLDYNQSVKTYNNRIQSLPLSLFAGAMGFQPMNLFESNAAGDVVPVVSFEDMKQETK